MNHVHPPTAYQGNTGAASLLNLHSYRMQQ